MKLFGWIESKFQNQDLLILINVTECAKLVLYYVKLSWIKVV